MSLMPTCYGKTAGMPAHRRTLPLKTNVVAVWDACMPEQVNHVIVAPGGEPQPSHCFLQQTRPTLVLRR